MSCEAGKTKDFKLSMFLASFPYVSLSSRWFADVSRLHFRHKRRKPCFVGTWVRKFLFPFVASYLSCSSLLPAIRRRPLLYLSDLDILVCGDIQGFVQKIISARGASEPKTTKQLGRESVLRAGTKQCPTWWHPSPKYPRYHMATDLKELAVLKGGPTTGGAVPKPACHVSWIAHMHPFISPKPPSYGNA